MQGSIQCASLVGSQSWSLVHTAEMVRRALRRASWWVGCAAASPGTPSHSSHPLWPQRTKQAGSSDDPIIMQRLPLHTSRPANPFNHLRRFRSRTGTVGDTVGDRRARQHAAYIAQTSSIVYSSLQRRRQGTMANHAGSSSSSRVQPSRLLFAAAVALLSFACTPAHAQVIRSDNSPVCNTYLPQCEAKCKRGEAYIFVCSAGNGPRGGPYLICRCAAPKLPVGPAQQSECCANWGQPSWGGGASTADSPQQRLG
jgi:hypothetical protein